ncbi:MAG: hypothetical protein K2O45_11220 [Oscillospiraceae bacterium]|nr:hypothetical protein [Oscillospiraceae bacterium]
MIKRAFFYTTRKRGKTLILLLTLFVISTFVLTGLSILAAADQSALSLRQSVGGSIKLERDMDNSQNWTYQQGIGGVLVDYTGTPITDADIEKVMSVKGIRDYNGIGDGSIFAMDFRLFQALASDKREITAASPPFLIPSISTTSGEGLSNWSRAVTSPRGTITPS